MSILDPKWKYQNAEETKKPGYLARKFAAERKRLRETAERDVAYKLERISKVRPMVRKP